MNTVETLPYLAGGRELCVTGCAVLWRGTSLLSKSILEFTDFSHCSLVVRMDEYLGTPDRVTCIEALATGLEPTFLSAQAKGYDGEVYLFIPDGLTPDIQRTIRAFALQECCFRKGYDYKSLLSNVFGRVREGDDAWFCSEFYGVALERHGLPRKPEYQSGLAARPGDVPVWWPGRLVRFEGPFEGGIS